MTDDNLQRIAERFIQRRNETKKSLTEAAAEADMSVTTWVKIEKGLPVRGITYVRAAEVLGWRSDAADRIVRGEEPVLAVETYERSDAEYTDNLRRELAAVRALLESAMSRLERIEDTPQDARPAGR